MRALLACCLVIAALISPPAFAADGSAELLALEETRAAAMTTGRWDAYAGLLAEDFFYNTTRGSSIGKAALLAQLRSGAVVLSSESREDLRVALFDKVGIVTGLMHVEATVDGVAQRSTSRFLHVWVDGESGWRLHARQVTPLPGGS